MRTSDHSSPRSIDETLWIAVLCQDEGEDEPADAIMANEDMSAGDPADMTTSGEMGDGPQRVNDTFIEMLRDVCQCFRMWWNKVLLRKETSWR